MSRRAIVIWIIVTVLITLAGGTYALIGNPIDSFDNRHFSPEAWRKATDAYDLDARARMCGDLMRHVIRVGDSEQRVMGLLGAPNRITDGEGSIDHLATGTHFDEYSIGNWTFLGMDDAFLYVHFDHEGHVVKTENLWLLIFSPKHLTRQCSERLPAVQPCFAMIKTFPFRLTLAPGNRR